MAFHFLNVRASDTFEGEAIVVRIERGLKRSLTALLVACSLLVADAIALNPVTPKVFENISAGTLEEFAKAGASPLKTNLLIDASAFQSPAIRTISAKLTHLGGNLYTASLHSHEVQSLRNIEGLVLDVNRPASTLPVSLPKAQSQMPDLIWDSATTIPETDPALVSARTAANIDGSGILVAVLDTGVDPEALGLGGGKVVHREDFTTPPSSGSCTDNGKLDPFGHGTHVASIIAGATDSKNTAIQGVAPGAQILDLRVLDCAGSGEFSSVDQALQWILDNRATYPVKVVNMSLGASDGQKDGLDPTSILINRLVAQGIFVAVAAGNGYAPASNLYMPSTAEFATTVASATVNKYGKFLAQYSSHGPTSDGRPGIDLTAPGSGIRAALTTAKSSLNNYETTMSGTSMASPYVAGIAALLLQQHPTASPSGTLCVVSADCPSGVVKASMTNGIQDLMKTSDWFAPGIDPDSGRGVVSASASINGTTLPPSLGVRGSLDSNSDSLIRVPAHTGNYSLSLLLDTSYRTDMWDKSTFSIMQVDAAYNQKSMQVVCTLLAETSCLFGEAGFTPRLFTFYLPASDYASTFAIKSSKAIDYTINIDSFQDTVQQVSGVKVSKLDLDGSTSGTITLERTKTSATDTVYQVSTTGSLSAQTSVTLPSGPAGTTASITVTSGSSSETSTDRVVFAASNGSLLASTVRNTQGGNGPLIFPNAFGYDDSDQPPTIFMADDGSILGSSSATGVANSSSYGNPYRVAANSRTVVKYDIAQTTASQIDSLGLSQDGSTGLFREYPAGAGIVPGDTTTAWTYFTRNLDSGASYEVGPDWSQWSAWNLAPMPPVTLNEDGTQVAWAITYPSGENPTVLVSQSGPNLATKTTLDSFSANTTLWLFGYSQGKVLVRVADNASLDELRLYTGANTYTVVPQSNMQAMAATFSANGQAVGYANWNTDTLRCSVGQTTTTFQAPSQLGTSYPTFVRVANDCSWMMVLWDNAPGWPRGKNGIQLIRIKADGTATRLDQTPGTGIGWIPNLAGTKFLRSTTLQLEPGDLNGMLDVYRGLGSQVESAIRLKVLPHLTWSLSANAVVFGSTLKLSAGSDNSSAAITYSLQNGSCQLVGDVLTPNSGTGGCQVEAHIASNDDYLESTISTFIPFAKATRPNNEVTFTPPGTVEVDSAINLNFQNPNSLPYEVTAAGACAEIDHVFKATYVGTCYLNIVRYEDENYLEKRFQVQIEVTKVTWKPSEFALNAVSTKYPGDTFDMPFTNNTQLNPHFSTSGSCSNDSSRVTIGAVGDTCTIYVSLIETDQRAAITLSRQVQVGVRQSVLGAILDTDWASNRVLPSGSSLTVNAAPILTSGACRVEALKVIATGSTGKCVFTVGGYSEGSKSFRAKTFTVSLGAATQKWTTALPTYTAKKLTVAKYIFITTGQPVTSLGLAGTFAVNSGCKVVKSGKTVAIDMGKLKKCVVTLKSAAGFRVPAISKTWTFTR